MDLKGAMIDIITTPQVILAQVVRGHGSGKKNCIKLTLAPLKPWPTKFLTLQYSHTKYPNILYYLYKYRHITETKEAVILVGGILNNLD